MIIKLPPTPPDEIENDQSPPRKFCGRFCYCSECVVWVNDFAVNDNFLLINNFLIIDSKSKFIELFKPGSEIIKIQYK